MTGVVVFFLHSLLHLLFSFLQGNAGDDIPSLKKELVALHQIHDARYVDSTLGLLRQHLARPSGIFDPPSSACGPEKLVEVARDKTDERASRFSVILSQTPPLFVDPTFQ